jgi:ribosome maturation factor RimP
VSSPGLGRPLKKERDYKRALGQRVEVHTYKIIDHEKSFTGVLKSYDDDTVTLELDDDGGEKVFNRADISLIRMAFDW